MASVIIENASQIINSSTTKSITSYNLSKLPFNSSDVRSFLAGDQESIYNESKGIDAFKENFDDEIFGSPLEFHSGENGLWNGLFVPPPPRPPFLEDILTEGVSACNLCSWALPTKKTFIFDGATEKIFEIGWPLTLFVVSILSAVLGAVIMVAIVKCRRKKPSSENVVNFRNANSLVVKI
ncbi:uncharacterized protein LOC129614796 isoform X2 [Condylostylus longicornis]|uniref:uncharacterized protein LOC129614796 isoform X2 n=1 Tax=Condylostylus longicornis TaxID=2530218 RepID=UPI00244E531C|nr:uncharacterized protein LOC129614796 isoform X2 [Condylostylus longicornis]